MTLDSEDLLESLVQSAADGDEQAWQRLWAAVEPRLSQIVAQPRFLGRLGQREDDRRNVVVDVLARLRADNFHRLRFCLETRATNPALKFMTWYVSSPNASASTTCAAIPTTSIDGATPIAAARRANGSRPGRYRQGASWLANGRW